MPEDFALEEQVSDPAALLIDVTGYEGPLDLLLSLARTQKVDLRRVSILQLAEQYLSFVTAARRLRIELAADYLVMASWLAYLKSRLLLPPDPVADGPSGAELAEHLAWALQRLETMRTAAARLMASPRLGRDFHRRGAPEAITLSRKQVWQVSLIDLMKAYARVKTREDYEPLHIGRAPVYTMEQALARLRGLIGTQFGWADLAAFLPEGWEDEPRRRSATAATFAALLELAKSGQAELRQDRPFGPLMARAATLVPGD